MRVVRFYQSALPPPHLPPPRPPPPPPRLAVLFLLVLLLASSFSFSSTMSASTSTCTSALPTLRQAICQLSSPTLCGKLFANFPAQCAPLDLNLGPSQLTVHRWTSTWDRSSSVCTATWDLLSSVLGFTRLLLKIWRPHLVMVDDYRQIIIGGSKFQ